MYYDIMTLQCYITLAKLLLKLEGFSFQKSTANEDPWYTFIETSYILSYENSKFEISLSKELVAFIYMPGFKLMMCPSLNILF